MSNKNSYIQMLKFTLFSISAGVIQVVSFALFNDVFKWIYWPAYLTSLILSILSLCNTLGFHALGTCKKY